MSSTGDENISNCAPSMNGDKVAVMSYIDPALFMKIESARGDVPRSKFIGKLISKSLSEAC